MVRLEGKRTPTEPRGAWDAGVLRVLGVFATETAGLRFWRPASSSLCSAGQVGTDRGPAANCSGLRGARSRGTPAFLQRSATQTVPAECFLLILTWDVAIPQISTAAMTTGF